MVIKLMFSKLMEVIAFFLFVTLASCTTTRFGYYPLAQRETVSMTERGASFPVHLGNSEGTVHAMSLGIVDLKSHKSGAQYSALHLGVTLFNSKGTLTWSVAPRDLKVQLSGLGTSIPAYVRSNSTVPATITIPPGTVRRVDLYYPLPPDKKVANEFNGFNFQWKLTSGKESFAQTTPFIRKPTHDPKRFVEVNTGSQHQDMVWDMEEASPSFWWYDSEYPSYMFPGMPLYPPLD